MSTALQSDRKERFGDDMEDGMDFLDMTEDQEFHPPKGPSVTRRHPACTSEEDCIDSVYDRRIKYVLQCDARDTLEQCSDIG